MWEARSERVSGGTRIRIFQDGERLSFRELFLLLESKPDFSQWYTQVLTDCSIEAFFWEHPPFNAETVDQASEFVLVRSARLGELEPDPSPFDGQFADQPGRDVITFPNLGGDALLIVPRPVGSAKAYTHLANFLRHGPEDQIRALWYTTGRSVRESLGPMPRWLSTAGLGVSWLHLRLDTRPKYYRFEAYKAAP